MKKNWILVLLSIVIIAIVVGCIIHQAHLSNTEMSKAFYRGTIVHTAKIAEGYIVYTHIPHYGDELFELLVTEETTLPSQLKAHIVNSYYGDYVEAIVYTVDRNLVYGHSVYRVISMDFVEDS